MKAWMRGAVGAVLLVLAAAAAAQEKFVTGPAAHRAGAGEYRVRLAVMPGDDPAAVAGQLEATYGMAFSRVGEGEWAVATSESRARLLSTDPHVAEVRSLPAQEIGTQDVASLWTSGSYGYDGSGNIKQAGNDAYVYDSAGRIVSGTAGPGRRQDYTYDAFGNLLTITTDGNTTTRIELGVDPETNRASNPAKNAYGDYDLAGNMKSFAGAATFVYDGLGMITESANVGERKLYLYTPDDERIAAIWVVNGVEARSEWTLRGADQKVLRRFVRTNDKWTWDEDYIYRGSQLLAAEVNRPEKTLRFHLDHLGTPRLITGNGGAEVSRHTYYPFGWEVSPPAGDTERMKFTGHERDRANLDYMHARYYAPMWGRFLSVDPTWDSADLGRPQSWNRYTYVLNNPINAVDPDGRITQLVVGGRSQNNVLGHVAIAINGRVYSYGTTWVNRGGDWGVPLKAYLGAQSGSRETTILTLKVTPQQEAALEKSLKANQPDLKNYDVAKNSCVTVCDNALQSQSITKPHQAGPETVDRAGNSLQAGSDRPLTPGGLAGQVQGQGLVTATQQTGQKVGLLRSLWGTVKETYERLTR